jgi:hypothetical protein
MAILCDEDFNFLELSPVIVVGVREGGGWIFGKGISQFSVQTDCNNFNRDPVISRRGSLCRSDNNAEGDPHIK